MHGQPFQKGRVRFFSFSACFCAAARYALGYEIVHRRRRRRPSVETRAAERGDFLRPTRYQLLQPAIAPLLLARTFVMYTMGLMKQIQSVYMLLLVAWYVL
jgi:hypothetical protein